MKAALTVLVSLPPQEAIFYFNRLAEILNEGDVRQSEAALQLQHITQMFIKRKIFTESEGNQRLEAIEKKRSHIISPDERALRVRLNLVKKYKSRRALALIASKIQAGASKDCWQKVGQIANGCATEARFFKR
ncbi:hypothetical protein KEM52_005101, partial [Ascosphaera acerosa]